MGITPNHKIDASDQPMRMRILIATCDRFRNSIHGTTDFMPFLTQFESIANFQNYSEDQKLMTFLGLLREPALTFYCQLGAEVTSSYNRTIEKMKERYCNKLPKEILRQQLAQIKQNLDEKIEDFADRVFKLGMEAYQGDPIPQAIVEEYAVDAFLRGVFEKRAAFEVSLKKPKTVSEACVLVRSTQMTMKTFFGERDMKIRAISKHETTSEEDVQCQSVRQIRAEASDKVDLKQQFSEFLHMVKLVLKDEESKKSNKHIQNGCFNCGEKGHFARDCPKEDKRGRSASRSPSPATRSFSPGNRSYSPRRHLRPQSPSPNRISNKSGNY